MRNKMRLLTPGPTPIPERVRLAMALDMVHHRKPGFKSLLAKVQEGLQYIFETREPVLSLTASGTGAMDAAVAGLFAPGEKVIVVEGGKFGERWREIAQAHDLTVVVLGVEWGRPVDPAELESVMRANPDARGVLVQASETSTGVMHPVERIAALTAKSDVLLLVDGISAVGISPCPMDKWGIDCLLTGSQKGLMVPPGLAFMALSRRAWAKAERLGRRSFYFDLVGEREATAKHQTLFTPAVSLLVGLEQSLELFREQGLEAIFRKQWALTAMCRAGVEAMGLELLVKTGYTWGLTSVLLPDGVDGGRVLAEAASRHGVVMAGGQGHMKSRIVRIGHMGYVDYGDLLAGLYALKSAVAVCGGGEGRPGFLEAAMTAYDQALAQGMPAS